MSLTNIHYHFMKNCQTVFENTKNMYMIIANHTPLSTLYNSLILKGLKFNNFLAKNCKPSIYRALEKRVESQVKL